MRDINFLRERRKSLSIQQQQDKRILLIAEITFGVIVLAFAVAFGVNIYLASQLNQIRSQQQLQRDQIVSNQSLELSFTTFVRKLSALSTLYQDRLDKKEAIAYFTNVFGPDVLIKKISFDQAEKLLVFRVQSNDIFHLQGVLSIVSAQETLAKFPTVNASHLSRDADGHYEMDVIVSTNKSGPSTATPSGTLVGAAK